jgi:hypothetical protein
VDRSPLHCFAALPEIDQVGFIFSISHYAPLLLFVSQESVGNFFFLFDDADLYLSGGHKEIDGAEFLCPFCA